MTRTMIGLALMCWCAGGCDSAPSQRATNSSSRPTSPSSQGSSGVSERTQVDPEPRPEADHAARPEAKIAAATVSQWYNTYSALKDEIEAARAQLLKTGKGRTTLNAKIEALKKHERTLDFPALDQISTGAVGALPWVDVQQVVGTNVMLVELPSDRWALMHGVSTHGVTDGRRIDLSDYVFEVSGTQSYTTVLGANKTVVMLTGFDRRYIDPLVAQGIARLKEAEKPLELDRADGDHEKRERMAAAKLANAKKLADTQPEIAQKFLRELESKFSDTKAGAEAKSLLAEKP